MNIVIDQGNTALKIARFDGEELLEKRQFAKGEEQSALDCLAQWASGSRHSIYSGVGPSGLLDQVRSILPAVLRMPEDLLLPIETQYPIPSQWGADRKAVCVGAMQLYPDREKLIIDAGSCITYDYMNAENLHLGGRISPGLQMRLKAMHHFTARLPLTEVNTQSPELATDTVSALQSGAFCGWQAEINSAIEAFHKRFPQAAVILTGGDHIHLAETDKNGIFAAPDLLLRGLNQILEYNVQRL